MSVEDEISDRLRLRFQALADTGRCKFSPEVWLLTWGHIAKGAKRVRADYVISLDDGPLLAVECKGRPGRAAELGDNLRQTADYARAQVATQVFRDDLPQAWIGSPIRWAALAYDYSKPCEWMQKHAEAAQRLFGPSNVGFFSVDRNQGLKFSLGGERYWSEERGWRDNAMVRATRIGSQRMGQP